MGTECIDLTAFLVQEGSWQRASPPSSLQTCAGGNNVLPHHSCPTSQWLEPVLALQHFSRREIWTQVLSKDHHPGFSPFWTSDAFLRNINSFWVLNFFLKEIEQILFCFVFPKFFKIWRSFQVCLNGCTGAACSGAAERFLQICSPPENCWSWVGSVFYCLQCTANGANPGNASDKDHWLQDHGCSSGGWYFPCSTGTARDILQKHTQVTVP